ncbi:isoprenylcysteine carboxylmethyltransferase family protein [Allokutzneria sp. NRRL B-24872]|uniref:methyltransferase family protein n=1 Tax=Allokutzneria sp. NRRL B-24872 TaxID=1137961 RepID=UPI001AEF6660|nr:isoprenylcysteine carboxylmethyltransferase family protein [Allokutzneria sp. NRRL B-24872]
MAAVALVLCVLYLTLAFGVRTVLHRRRTGSSGFHGISGRAGSAQWWGGVLFAAAVTAGLAGPAAQVAGLIGAVLDHPVLDVVGIVLAVAGIVGTLLAQQAMGAAWRIGVDPDESTDLVRLGPYAHVRNPVFTAMIITAAGLTLIAGDVLSLLAFLALVVAIHLQVRTVEEPYLLAHHGQDYERYLATTGRYLPRLPRRSDRTG